MFEGMERKTKTIVHTIYLSIQMFFEPRKYVPIKNDFSGLHSLVFVNLSFYDVYTIRERSLSRINFY